MGIKGDRYLRAAEDQDTQAVVCCLLLQGNTEDLSFPNALSFSSFRLKVQIFPANAGAGVIPVCVTIWI